ncbi:MAG TPA: hypothetical protein PLQ67_08335 [Burkholderiaceae bacterium]|nr:hypothetical protein [Burkholderiaceae bacterium]
MKAHNKTRVLAGITLMAFVMDVLLPFVLAFALPAASAQAAHSFNTQAPSSQRVLICTAQGFKWVALEERSNAENKPQPSKHVSCPVCCAGSHLAKAPPPFDPFKLFARLDASGERSAAPTPHSIKARLLALGHFSRGPPQA